MKKVFYLALAIALVFGTIALTMQCGLSTLSTAITSRIGSAVRDTTAPEKVKNEISKARIKEVVSYLASKECEGRFAGTTGDRKAQDYIINQFKKAGILPGANNNSYQQIFKLENGNKTANLIGYLPGNDPKLKNELIIVSGHYDHLGMKNGKMYPGANDNASGTAATVELAYAFGKLKSQIKRSIVFIAFGNEEGRIKPRGAKYYVNHTPSLFPLSKTKYMLDYDMVGQGFDKLVDLSQSKKDNLVNNWFKQAFATSVFSESQSDDFSESNSEYDDAGQFTRKNIHTRTYAGDNGPTYHQPSDKPDTLNYEAETELVKMGYSFVWKLAQAPNLGAVCQLLNLVP
jgi:hypothetical protein